MINIRRSTESVQNIIFRYSSVRGIFRASQNDSLTLSVCTLVMLSEDRNRSTFAITSFVSYWSYTNCGHTVVCVSSRLKVDNRSFRLLCAYRTMAFEQVLINGSGSTISGSIFTSALRREKQKEKLSLS